MTSNRKRKKQERSLGLSERELQLAVILEEVLEQTRWLWVLAYSNQFLLNEKLDLDPEERDRILEASARAVERDGRLQEWQDGLAHIKEEAAQMDEQVRDVLAGEVDRAEPVEAAPPLEEGGNGG